MFILTRLVLPALLALAVMVFAFQFVNSRRKGGAGNGPRQQHEKLLNNLNSKAPQRAPGNDKEALAADEPGIAAYHDFLTTFDPATGTVPRERLLRAEEATRTIASMKSTSGLIWQGFPSDMGGRTRAMMYDPNDASHKKVWAGGVTGGLWYNTDITNPNNAWVPVSDFWNNMAIRCIVADPGNPQRFYVGSGEAETAMQTYRESSGVGFGIGRSDDGGQHWYHIPGTEQFAYVTDLVIRIENGASVIYAGVASGLYKGSQHLSSPSDGLFRSTDGGATWTQVLPLIPGSTVPYCVSDIALGADNRLYAGTRPNLDGEGAAVLLYSDDGINWTANAQFQTEIINSAGNNIPGRVVLATAPSDPNVVYALIADGFVNPANGFKYFYCDYVLWSPNKGISWAKKALPSDLTSGSNFATIAWHALDIAVDPNNASRVFIGGLDVHVTPDGGNTWSRISDWSLMYSGGGPRYIHADQHIILFKPGSSTEILFGTDGGVHYTANGTSSLPDLETRNKSYSTLQFYTCALHPDAGSDIFYGGLQDNGTLYYTGTPLAMHDMVSGGDGACCFIDQQDPATSITSHYYNNYYIFDNAVLVNYVSDWTSGTFVSPSDFDYRNKLLFSNAVDYIGTHQDCILRLDNLTGGTNGTFLNLQTGSTVFYSALTWSPYSPAGKSTLFAGTESGRLFRVAEAQSNSPVVTEIGASGFPTASISCIAVGKSEDTLLVTFSNYGVASLWLTYDGGQTWRDVEGNLPDMPVRWALFHPQNNNMAMIATETGVWMTSVLNLPTVTWSPVNDGMANVRTDMLALRKSDNTVLAATHGRGFFTTTWDLSTGKPESETKTAAQAFPNPTGGILQVSAHFERAEKVTLSLLNLKGKEVYKVSFSIQPGDFNRSVDLTGEAKGVYLVLLKGVNGTILSEKVVLE